jgi:hypothetical protein
MQVTYAFYNYDTYAHSFPVVKHLQKFPSVIVIILENFSSADTVWHF